MPQGPMARQVVRKLKSQVLVKVCWDMLGLLICIPAFKGLSSLRVQELCCGSSVAILISLQLWGVWLCLSGCKALRMDSSLHEQH